MFQLPSIYVPRYQNHISSKSRQLLMSSARVDLLVGAFVERADYRSDFYFQDQRTDRFYKFYTLLLSNLSLLLPLDIEVIQDFLRSEKQKDMSSSLALD